MTTARILVADDQADTLELARTVLASAGFDVVTAPGGREALERLERESWDLLLLDINMPGIDGWEVLRRIRADHALAGLPVVMFSVKGEAGDKIQALQEGADDYVTKPFVVDRLVARLRRVLDLATASGAEER